MLVEVYVEQRKFAKARLLLDDGIAKFGEVAALRALGARLGTHRRMPWHYEGIWMVLWYPFWFLSLLMLGWLLT